MFVPTVIVYLFACHWVSSDTHTASSTRLGRQKYNVKTKSNHVSTNDTLQTKINWTWSLKPAGKASLESSQNQGALGIFLITMRNYMLRAYLLIHTPPHAQQVRMVGNHGNQCRHRRPTRASILVLRGQFPLGRNKHHWNKCFHQY